MFSLFETVTDLCDEAATLRRRPYGVIEVCEGRLVAVHLRPWPKLVSGFEAWWDARGFHQRASGNRCWIYYNQPRSCPNYLALAYVLSTRDTMLASARAALATLDEIARLKQTDAIVCDASNGRISDRLLTRWGWESHLPDSGGRHYIKRFYGVYPEISSHLLGIA